MGGIRGRPLAPAFGSSVMPALAGLELLGRRRGAHRKASRDRGSGYAIGQAAGRCEKTAPLAIGRGGTGPRGRRRLLTFRPCARMSSCGAAPLFIIFQRGGVGRKGDGNEGVVGS